MQIDFAAREMTIKLVYYGPALSGKTTNLQSLHERGADRARGRLMTLETRDDRTLFFDLLPLTFRGERDLSVRVKLFTVPGQVLHASTRRLVLQGADGVAFVADSQNRESRHNAEAFLDLRTNLRGHGLELGKMPVVIQFNKRDLPDVRSHDEIVAQAKRGKEPVFTAVATRGEGVVETFVGLFYMTWKALDTTHDLASKFGLDHGRLVDDVVTQFGETRTAREILSAAICADGRELMTTGSR